MTSVGIGEASTLHEAKYIFTDFTAIDTAFIEKLIKG
jgi:beta-phosphoglucomutase